MNRYFRIIQVLLFVFVVSKTYSQPFTDSGIALPSVSYSSVAWGDYDNDGDLDILLTGMTGGGFISSIFQNNAGAFSDINAGLTGVNNGSGIWGDYDSDGDLDIFLAGGSNSGRTFKIYRNDSGVFSDINTGLPGADYSSLGTGDYDNDGDLDVLLTGRSVSGNISKIYCNNGNNTFSEQTNILLTGVARGSGSWGDYDNDGDLDILLNGEDANSTMVSKIYQNNGNNLFTELTSASLIGLAYGSGSWGDFDNDGDLDILLSGWLGLGLTRISRIYRNDNSSFIDINAGLTGVPYNSAWGDYDNDGDLDVILAGFTGSEIVTKIYRNEGNNSFTEQTSISLPGVANGSLAWADYDNDSDLDIILTDIGSGIPTKIYRNNIGTANTKPSIPSNLNSSINAGIVTLSWNKATDSQTAQNGLNYNLYVYESGQSTYKSPPHAFRQNHVLNGRRLVAKLGNIQWGAAGYQLLNLPPEKIYYWTIQAVDCGFLGGNFAAEKSFTIPLYRPVTQSNNITFSNILINQVTATWSIGGGVKRAVFIKSGTGTFADPVDNTTYSINSTTPGGWKCVYNGSGNIATISGLSPGTNYSVHICEYNGAPGTEKYLKTSVYQNPVFINTVYTEQTGITLQNSSGSSVVWGDSDSDGDLDILFSGSLPMEIYNGTLFTEITNISLTTFPIGGSAAWGDYDNDGDLDILVSGFYYKSSLSKIFTNNGNKTFSDPNISISGLRYQSVAWGDYDNDGDLDILMAGQDNSDLKTTKIYSNNGNKTFTEQISISLTGADRSSVAWGDYDNDNDLDILLTGRDPNSGLISRIYRNDLNNQFTEQKGISLRGVEYGSGSWGDYDSDGDLDILITGQESDARRISTIYRNNGNNSFTEMTGITLPGVYYGSGSWGDYDNDGDLDILLTGQGSDDIRITKIIRNNGGEDFSEETGIHLPGVFHSYVSWADYDNDGDLDILVNGLINEIGTSISKVFKNNSLTINDSPGSPSNLGYNVSNSRLLLKWNRVLTDETSPKSLTYNVRMGRTSGKVNFVSPHSASNGFRKIPSLGNAQLDTTFLFNYRWDTLYFASVQAIDNSFKGGTFSNEIQIQISPVQPSDLNAINKSSNSILLRWERGNGNRCILFAKEGTTGTAIPQNLTTYYANPVFAEGSPIGTTGWYCIFKGEADSLLLSGLNPSKNYRIHAIEFQGTQGSEIYASIPATGNIGTFSTALFTEQTVGLNDAGISSAAWGDYDNDGDLDILLTGAFMYAYSSPSPSSAVYKNNGDNTFTKQTSISLPNVYAGSSSWGDYDCDGDLDILLTGYTGNAMISKVFQNINGSAFTEQTQIILSGVGYSSCAWGDYDNDGDLDILLTGATTLSSTREPVSKIYRNNGNNTFSEQTSIILPPVFHSSVAWGDYDKDGYLDFLLTGASGDTYDYNPVSRIYHNNGDNTFTENTEVELPGVFESSVAWVDYDNDSDLDILLTGATSSVYSNKSPVSKIYQNNGDGTFTEQTEINLTGVYSSSVACGDYDNDGDMDLLITGSILPASRFSSIYKNNGNNIFTEQEDISIIYVGGSSVNWGDYDNDGDLDFFLTGVDANDNVFSRIYKNNAVMESIISPNIKPDAPSNLTSELSPGNVRLSWSPVNNDETPTKAMSYNLRWRLKNDTIWYFAPHSAANGLRRVVSMGNIQMNKYYDLKEWPVGTWEWQVQAVDQGYQGGTWSEINTFTVKNTQAFFKTDVVCKGSPTHFTDQSVATDGIASWKWDFKDGTFSTLQNPSHTYSSSGTYNVKLVVTSYSGTKDSLLQDVIVKARPSVSFTAPNVCEGTITQITNSTNTNGLTISNWYWDFGDGYFSTAQNPVSHTYSLKGAYQTKLRVDASNSCSDSLTKEVLVAGYPNNAVSGIGKTTFCMGDSVSLVAEKNTLYSYQWRLDNNNIVNANSNSYIVKSYSGAYSVEIINTQANCVSTSGSTAVVINPSPSSPYISESGSTNFCEGDSVVLSVTKISGYSYQWKLNGGTVGIDSNRIAAKTSGKYNLMVLNSIGCSATSSNSIDVTVNSTPAVSDLSTSGPTTFCKGDSVTLSIAPTTGYSYSWRNEYGPVTNATTNIYIVKSSSTYQLDVTNTSGCSIRTSPVKVTVKKSPIKPVIESVNYVSGKCPGENPVRLYVKQPVAEYDYQWFKNGLPGISDSLSYIEFYEAGNYKLTADLDGCTSESAVININFPDALPKPIIYAQGPSVWYLACSYKSDNCIYKWYYNDKLIADAKKYYYVANRKMGDYKVSIGNNLGCYTMSDPVTIPTGITGIEDPDAFNSLNIYPNPSEGLFTMELNNQEYGDLLIRVLSLDGKELFNFKFQKSTDYFSSQIDLTRQPEGNYLIIVDLNKEYTVRKIIIE